MSKLAIIKTGGKQYIVTPGKKIKIEKVDTEEGKEINFKDVLLFNNGKETKIGNPYISGTEVKAKVLAHDRHKKNIIFKYKPKKRYKVKRGHRQPYSEVEILDIASK